MNKSKKIFIITITFLMLLGLTTITATDIDNNDTTTITQTSQINTIDTTTKPKIINKEPTNTKEVSSSQTDNIHETTNTQETINNKNGEKTQNLKADRTETANSFADLSNYLTSNVSDTVTINIGADIVLESNTTVNNAIKTLTINGNNKTIDGNNQYSFLYNKHPISITINNLTITQCYSTENGGAIYSGGYYSNITIINTNLLNNNAKYGGGIYVRNYTNTTIINSKFTNNHASIDGGAIYAYLFNTITITNSSFNNNYARDYGGLIRSYYNSYVTITNCNITNNSARGGGAIYGSNNLITNSNFTNNKVIDSDGGAITGSNITVKDSLFLKNQAERINNKTTSNGGAISGNNLTIINSKFYENNATNRGGAIIGENIIINNTEFINNTAVIATGGAIDSSNLTLNNTIFIKNNGSHGGAIYNIRNLTITNSKFIENTAFNGGGGAIKNYGDGLIQNSNFTKNKVITNFSLEGGGAIQCYDDTNIIIVDSSFTKNEAPLGGAMRGYNISIKNTNFSENYAGTGGAIYGNGYKGTNYVNGEPTDIRYYYININNSNFFNNTANHGGAIGGMVVLTNIINTNFTNNNATHSGGAIDAKNISLYDSHLEKNNANYGGGICGNNITITNTNFTNNTAKYGGGAISGGDVTITYSKFIENSALNGIGGAIYGNSNSITITNTNFTNNTAKNTGGAIYNNGNLTLKYSNIIDNYINDNEAYVIDFCNAKAIIITDNTFINNTDNVHDMLFSDASKTAEVDIHSNTYIDNFLEDTIIKPNVTIVTDNKARPYDYYIDLNLREIYNDAVRNGTLNVYVNGILKDTINVTNSHARILFGNSDLTKRENNITLEYITLSKHYQNTSTSLILYKEVNTTLSIQAPSTMTAGDVAVINFTLKDVNNNPLSGETIHVLVDEEQVDTVTTDSNGIATYIFKALGNDTVNIEATHHTSNDSFYLSAQDAVAKIKVNIIEPKIFISNNTIVPNVETNITINLFDDSGNPIKNKTLNVNITEEGKPDITGTVTTEENGIAVFTFTPTDEGTLNVTVTSPGDLIYHEASESVQISKNFITTHMFVNASSMKINETNTIIIEVLTADGKLISGTVELDIDGENHTVNITNGRGTYHDYKSATAGEKNVTAKFTSSIPGYANVTTKEKFNVEKLPTRVTIESINRTAGNVTLKVLVFPEDHISSIVDGGNVVIESVNGENRIVIYNNTLENGELIYLTAINQTGWYEFETTYHGNDYFLGEENNTGSLQVLLVNTTTITFNKTARVGDTITLNATVTDVDGNPVNDGNITFLIDRTLLEAKLENGIATTEYTLPTTYTKGNYTIKANYTGTNKYNTSSGEAKLSIDLQETSMNVNILNDTKGNTTIEVTLNSTPDNKPISGADIIITDKNGNPIGEGTTDNNGVANITITVPVGDNEITISYLGDDIHSPQEETKTVNVTPRESETTGTIINNTVGNVTIDVQVVDPVTGEPVTGPVNITLNGEVVGNSTLDDEGRTTIPANITGKGNYTLVVEYSGNDDYNGSTDTLEDVYIKGKDVAVDVIIDNPVVGETEVIITIVDPETGKPIPNAPVVITLPNGTNVTGKTDDKGTATIPVDLPSGDNNITISYTGDKTHEDKEIKNTIRVKSYSVVTVNPVTGVVLDNVTFTANVVDYQDKPVTGGYIQFSVGGRTLKDENGKNIRILVENGVAKLSYKAESGWIIDTHPDLTVQAVYTGTSIVLANRSETNKVSIYKRNATVTVSAPDDYVNGTLHIDAIVKDQNGSLINDGNLVFKLNGLSLKDENNKGIVAQVKNGKVQLSVKLPFAYSAKKYNLTAVYSNKIYNKATGMNTTTLKAIPTYITAIAVVSDQFSKPVVTGQIYNKNNNAILQGTAVLNIKFDGISYAKKVVVNNGTFSETLEGISIYKPGTHKVEIAVGANSHYEAVRETYTPKATAKYDATPVITNITRNKTTTRVQAKILDTHNRNAQKDLKITIKVNGLSFLVNQTVKNGKVDVLVDTSTLKNRTYNLELVSGANTYYNAGKATTELPKY